MPSDRVLDQVLPPEAWCVAERLVSAARRMQHREACELHESDLNCTVSLTV